MEMREQFDKYDTEFIKFDRIENPPFRSPDICAMAYIEKLMPEHKGDIIVGADHDIVWLATPETLTDDDVIYLRRCGVHWSSEGDCLGLFC
jgi:hypothetical protein